MKPTNSLIIPVYRNADSIPRLTEALAAMAISLNGDLEVVLVVDGHADNSYGLLKPFAESAEFPVTLVAHSRNFGSFAAIRTGLEAASGEVFAVMAADLQEPPELIETFFELLREDKCDVVVGQRIGRADSWWSNVTSGAFWWLYRKLINADIPPGGVDVFGCNLAFKQHLLALRESHSSLVALLFWLGFRRETVGYERVARQEGQSAWSLSKKLSYMNDSIFAFTNFPIRIFTILGTLGLVLSFALSAFILFAHAAGVIEVPGYAPIMLSVLGLGSLNLLGLGIIGNYAWRAYENSKARPLAVVETAYTNPHYS